MSSHELNSRSLEILNRLVELYIQDGQPIGSKALARQSQLQLSSATIRHIMADLEVAGLLSSPHTSAGRIPTVEGYRLFASQLLTVHADSEQFIDAFRQRVLSIADGVSSQANDKNNSNLIEQASTLLSDITQLAALVTLPKYESLIVKQIEFLPLSEKRVLVILVLNDSQIQNRIINTDRQFSRRELEQAGCYLNECFAGRDFLSIRDELLERMQQQRADLEMMLQVIMEMVEAAKEREAEYVLAGENKLFDAVDLENYHHLRDLFDAFSQKRDILHLLDRSLNAQGIQIFIGKESGHDLLEDYSLVTAPYSVNDQIVGVLGVIGPTRMPYDRAISALNITSKLLSQSLDVM